MSFRRSSLPFAALPALLLAAVLLATPACVSKSAHEKLQATLSQCETEKGETQQQLDEYRAKYEVELQKQIGEQSEALADFQDEFQSRLAKIEDTMPEVASDLSKFISVEFSKLSQSNQQLQGDLQTANQQLLELRQDLRQQTSQLSGQAADIQSETTSLRQDLEASRGERARLLDEASSLVADIQQFDHTRLECRQCPEYMSPSRSEREAIHSFHQQLINRLSELQRNLGVEP